MTQRFVLIRLSVLMLFLVISLTALAQTGTIKGIIKDAKTNEPLIGASVLVEGTTNGAAADLDGNYVIQNVAAGTHTLIVSYVSYNQITHTGVVVESNSETVLD
ncbi:carboxypeptidase-like regulatory domain-containing protein, partial [Lascolabacillus sp.]|uniref:carboxypeptidase-like regulatory domain-containing protein n=2 Tax=Lascolabacillus sp. TaxID=1924068 RepID=UPI0025828634